MADDAHEDHGPVKEDPISLAIAGIAFVILLWLGFQLWSSAGHAEVGSISQQSDH